MSDFSLALNEDQLQHPEVGPRLRRGRRAPGGRGVGRAGGVPVADRRRRPPRSASTASTSWPTPCSATPPASPCRSPSRSCSGATPASACRSSARASPPPASPATAPPSRSSSGCRSATAPPTTCSSAPSACPSPTPAPTCRSLRTRAVYDEAKDEWVLNGTKAWITNGGIADIHVVVAAVDPELKGRGQASFVVPPEHAGPVAGPEVQEARHPRLAHRRGRARRRAGPRLAACSAARRSSTRSWPRPARRDQAEDRLGQAAGDGHLRGHPPGRRRPGRRHRPGRLRVLAASTPRSARRSASRSS